MNLQEYVNLSEKTLSSEFHSDKKMEKILHSVVGSLTEIEELLDNYENEMDPINLIEEIGDIFWYLSILFREFNLSLDNNPYKSIEIKSPFKLILDYLKVNLKMLDSLKKKLYYNKEIDIVTFINQTYKLYSLLESYCIFYNTDINLILEKNILKLKARYGEKFSSEKAINRDLDLEKKILENE